MKKSANRESERTRCAFLVFGATCIALRPNLLNVWNRPEITGRRQHFQARELLNVTAFSSPVEFSKSVFGVKFRAKFEVVLLKQFLSVVANHSRSDFSNVN